MAVDGKAGGEAASVAGEAPDKSMGEGEIVQDVDDDNWAGVYPVMLDSNRPRDEWNISQVKAETTNAAGAVTKAQMIVTTHEDEFVALNNDLKDGMMPSSTQMGGQDLIVFPRGGDTSPQGDSARQKAAESALLADRVLIQEIGSE